MFIKNKKAASFVFGIFLVVIIMVVAAAILIPIMTKSGKTSTKVSKDILDPAVACTGKLDGEICYLSGQKGYCNNFRCELDINIPTTEKEAIAVFRTHFKDALAACLKDTSECEKATTILKSILSYSNTKDEGLVFIAIENYNIGSNTEDRSIWKIVNRGKFLRGSKSRASWEYEGGGTCWLKNYKEGDEPSAESVKVGEIIIGKDPKGYAVIDRSEVRANTFTMKAKVPEQVFLSFERHEMDIKVGTETVNKNVLCIHTAKP